MPGASSQPQSNQMAVSGNLTHHIHHSQTVNLHSFRQVLLATALVKVRAHTGGFVVLRALLDQGGDGTSITEAAAQLLKLPVTSQEVEVKAFGGGTPLRTNKMVELHLRSLHNNQFNVNVSAVVMNTLTDVLPARYVKIDKWPHIEGLKLADPEFFKPRNIDLVIGADVYSCVLLDGLRKGPIGTPTAQNSELGWFLSGPISDQPSTIKTIIQNHVLFDLNASVQRFFEVESVPEINAKSKEDEYTEEFFARTVTRAPDGRLQMRLPFRTPNDKSAVLGASKHQTKMRFFALERRLNAHSEIRSEYVKGMQDYIQQNHMKESTDTEEDRILNSTNDENVYQSYYFAHHSVIKECSTTTKLRNVFNASAKTSNGKSLNDILYPGPVMLADLNAVLLNWRCHKIAFVADITQMYRQIHIHPEDTTYQRLFWRCTPNDELKEYQMTRLTFGTNFAPSFAIMGLQYLAKLNEQQQPNGANIVTNDTYMDDTMSGNANIELALRDQRETIELLKSGGFELRKWASNAIELVQNAVEEARETNVQLSNDGSTKTLGVYWDTTSDTFSYRTIVDIENAKFTKRAILSTICKYFDPLGLISPLISRAKIIMKEIWKTDCEWDAVVNLELQNMWRKYLIDLKFVVDIKIDRWIRFAPDNVSFQLHGFCDASMLAYGAVVYLRTIDSSNAPHITLITSKSRVAPMKPLTIPRLELCGAVLLAELMDYVLKTIRHVIIEPKDVKLWCDSQTALQWIRNDASRWQMFVANRVTSIQRVTKIEQWNHVRTHDNPADLISRGASPQDLQTSQLWWHGQLWLCADESKWPEYEFEDTEPIEEKKCIQVNTHTISRLEYMNRFSRLRNLIRSTAWFRRLFTILRKGKKNSTAGTLTVAELTSATHFWIRDVQQHAFGNELNGIRNGAKSYTPSRLKNLNPFIDSEGILRVGGRLRNSNWNFDEQHPIILPDKHHFTNLVIDSAHLRTMHGGCQLTMAYMRKTYWVLNAKKSITSRIHHCIICHRQKAKLSQQLMADLPAPRVRISKPFTHTGVDFCGPFFTRPSRGRGIKTMKSYVAVYVCLCTKAIHLDLVSDLTSNAFLASLRRLISRRGLPKCMYSDCGTNFVGANKIIKDKQRDYEKYINRFTITSLANEGIDWKFNPPASPHFGGLFEAGVKSTKFHLKRVLGNASLCFEDFYTVLTEIEACLNSRPLVTQSSDPDDLSPITPGHFLTGDSLLALPEPSIEDETVAIGNRYRIQRKLRDDFWAQWNTDYLSRMINRPKWYKQQQNIQINDMVLVCDERLPPTKWALARVIATHPGSDGLVRVVTIRTSTGEYKRPVAKLSVLPIVKDLDSNKPV